jgi:hypothetical protein
MNARRLVSFIVLALLFIVTSKRAVAADVLATWDGSTNVWHSTSNWWYSSPSSLGYPSNGLETYDVRIDAGEVTGTLPGTITSLQLNGGRLVLEAPLSVESNFVWASGDIDSPLSPWLHQRKLLEVRGGIHIITSTPRKLCGPLQVLGESRIDGPVEISGHSFNWSNLGPVQVHGPCRLAAKTRSVFWSSVPMVKTGAGELLFGTNVAFASHGGLEVQSGTVRVQGEGGYSGKVEVKPGAALHIGSSWNVRSDTAIYGPGLVRIQGDEDNPSWPGARLGGYDLYSHRPGLTVLTNVNVEICNGSLGHAPDPRALSIDSRSQVTFLSTNFRYGSVSGTNAGAIFVKGSGDVWLNVDNENLLQIENDGFIRGKARNRGLIIKTAGSGRTVVGPDGWMKSFELENNGTVEVRSGTLVGTYTGTNYGCFIARAGTTNAIVMDADLRGAGASFRLATGTRFSGDGDHHVSGEVTGSVTNYSKVNAGEINGAGTFFNMAGAVLYAGIIDATVVNFGYAIGSHSSQHVWHVGPLHGLRQSNFVNHGTFEWRDGNIEGFVNNEALILKTSSSNFMVRHGTVLNNRGTLHVQDGSLILNNAFTNTGTLVIGSNGVVVVASEFVLTSAGRLEGPGKIIVSNAGNLIVSEPFTNSVSVLVDGGTLTTLADYTATGTLIQSNGIITGPGNIVIARGGHATTCNGSDGPGAWRVQEGGQLTVAPGGQWPNYYLRRRIENDGVLYLGREIHLSTNTIVNRGFAQSEGSLSGSPASVVNEGHWLIPTNATFHASWMQFTNRGRWEIRGAMTTSSLHWMSFLQESGELALRGGSWSPQGSSSAVAELRGGTLTGSGSISGTALSFGTVSPGPLFGTLALNDLHLARGSSVVFDLGGTNAGSFDRVDVDWNVWCSNDVTFVVRLANGFMPHEGDRFEVMRFHWAVPFGEPVNFPQFRGLTLANGLRLAPVLTYWGLVLVAMSPSTAQGNPLHITRSQNNSFQLHWPRDHAGYVLQQTTNLSSPWNNVLITEDSRLSWDSGRSPQAYFRLIDLELPE